MSTTIEPSAPSELLRCDEMVKNHPRLEHGPESAIWLWRLSFGKRTYMRFRRPQNEGPYAKPVWCRVMNDRAAHQRTLFSYPYPRQFFDSLFHQINREQ